MLVFPLCYANLDQTSSLYFEPPKKPWSSLDRASRMISRMQLDGKLLVRTVDLLVRCCHWHA
eukprot:scaffold51516_cov54-Phaeocystis_antarctica.AAC.1